MKNMLSSVTMLLLIAVCARAAAGPVALTDNNVRGEAEPIIASVQESYNTGNYGMMARYFSEEMFGHFSQDDFEAMRANIMPLYGVLNTVEYLAFITQLGDTHVLYRGKFEKSDGLIKLMLSREAGRVVIIGLYFE